MARDGLDWEGQLDFSAGAFPLQERVPPNAVEDAINTLFEDDGSPFKRGGGAYKSTSDASAALLALYDRVLAGGQRTTFLLGNNIGQLAADDVTPVNYFGAYAPGVPASSTVKRKRPAVLAGMLLVPVTFTGKSSFFAVAGSRKTAAYNTGTFAATQGSRTIAGTGTSWLANADAGMIFNDGAATYLGVAKVVSDTELALSVPWPLDDVSGASYILLPAVAATSLTPLAYQETPLADVFVAAGANKLFAGAGSLISVSPTLDPLNWGYIADNYLVLPDGGALRGLQAFGGSMLAFTTDGLYRIANIAYDMTDAMGNAQQVVSDEGHDVVLWDDMGIAAVDGAVLVPALDDLYTYSAAGIQKFNAPGMRKQYRSYVKAGYVLGGAAVHRGHYFLPILDAAGTTLQDLLVLKLATGAWSRWSGHSAGVSFARRAATASAPPKLLAAKSSRILELSGTFEPAAGNKNEADGSTHTWQVTCRTVQRKTAKDLLRKVRVRYELDDAAADNPTITAEVAVGRPGSAFTALTGSGAENVGQTPKTWTNLRFRSQEFRLRLTSVGPSSSLVLRSVEYAFRPSGRQ